MKYVISDRFSCLLMICSLFLVSACATVTKPKTVSIEERVTARWNALLSDDLVGAYEYLSPGYRSSVTSVQYQRSILLQRVQWTNAEFRSSECTENTCDVTVALSFKISGALPGVRTYKGKKTVKESWIKVDDIWYIVP